MQKLWLLLHQPNSFQGSCMHAKLLQSCPTLCDPMDCNLPGSSVHGILHARILEWVAMPSSRGSSWPRNWTPVSCIAGKFFTVWATREAQLVSLRVLKCETLTSYNRTTIDVCLKIPICRTQSRPTKSEHLGMWNRSSYTSDVSHAYLVLESIILFQPLYFTSEKLNSKRLNKKMGLRAFKR